ncbi:hypothetical protein KAJ27_20605 [bacterium]|nr:hypothetical protein [bacterium]
MLLLKNALNRIEQDIAERHGIPKATCGNDVPREGFVITIWVIWAILVGLMLIGYLPEIIPFALFLIIALVANPFMGTLKRFYICETKLISNVNGKIEIFPFEEIKDFAMAVVRKSNYTTYSVKIYLENGRELECLGPRKESQFVEGLLSVGIKERLIK